MFYDVVTLIKETPAAHGAFEEVEETARTVYCGVQSVTRSEYYAAFSAGLAPESVLVISNRADYDGEKIVVFHGERMRVLRVYSSDDAVELTVGKDGVR